MAKVKQADASKVLRTIRRLSGSAPAKNSLERLDRILALATGEEDPDKVFVNKTSSTLAKRLAEGQASRSPRRTTQPSGRMEASGFKGITAAAEAERDELDRKNAERLAELEEAEAERHREAAEEEAARLDAEEAENADANAREHTGGKNRKRRGGKNRSED